MRYDPPGWADRLDARLLRKWNRTIRCWFRFYGSEPLYKIKDPPRSDSTLASPFFASEPPTDTTGPVVEAKWSPQPLLPITCVGLERAQELCDRGLLGRRTLHAEYAEYRVVCRRDKTGRRRPKRVEVTTELPDYWLCVARHDPLKVREMATEVLGFEPSWMQLYGIEPDQITGTPRARERELERRFAQQVTGVGAGSLDRLPAHLKDVPEQPTGSLNRGRLLCMTFSLNRLGDLIEILLMGAHPWAAAGPAGPRPADFHAVFRVLTGPEFACRRSDPVFIAEGQDAAFNGFKLALANPPGIYMLGFTPQVFRFQDKPLDDDHDWVRFSRGAGKGYRQRLEFGPPDELADVFLDDIIVDDGTEAPRPLTGGFQVLQQLEVGVRLVRWGPTSVAPGQFEYPGDRRDWTPCNASKRCGDVLEMLDGHEQVRVPKS